MTEEEIARFAARAALFPNYIAVRYSAHYVNDYDKNEGIDGRWLEYPLKFVLRSRLVDLVPPGTDFRTIPPPKWKDLVAAFPAHIAENPALWEALKAKCRP